MTNVEKRTGKFPYLTFLYTVVYLFTSTQANASLEVIRCSKFYEQLKRSSQLDIGIEPLIQGKEISPGVFLLGEGKTSKVYRVVVDGQSHIYKDYEGWESPMTNDLLAAEYLHKISKTGWRSAIYTRDPSRTTTVVVQDFRGVDVAKYYASLNINSKVRFLEKYNEWINKIVKDIQKHSPGYSLLSFEASTGGGFKAFTATLEDIQNGKMFNLWIKAENVLVLEDETFVIVDPK